MQSGNYLERVRCRFGRRHGSTRRGLTLVELAIVILVLGVIMAIVYGSLSQSTGVINDAQKLKTRSQADMLRAQWDLYEGENPPLEDGQKIDVFIQKRKLKEEMVNDTWKRPYFVCRDEKGDRQLCTYGKDGVQGGDGENKDFYLTDQTSWPEWLSGAPKK